MSSPHTPEPLGQGHLAGPELLAETTGPAATELATTVSPGTEPPGTESSTVRPVRTGATQAPERAHRWGFGAFLLVLGVFLVSSVVVGIPFQQEDERLSAVGIVVSIMVPSLLQAAVALLVTVVRGNGPRIDLRLRWSWSDVLLGFKIGVGALVVTLAASQLWAHWVGESNANSAVGAALDGIQLGPVLAVLLFLHVWLIAPLCEEIVYRGLLWGAIERLQWGRWTAFVLSTAIFAIAHLEPWRTPLLLVIAVPIGLARLITGRLVASIVAHQVNNLLPAVGILLMVLGVMPA
ncbi:MAG TPA: type II CAAX endopeptidase family protein [Pseudonocardiaceae bacterium]